MSRSPQITPDTKASTSEDSTNEPKKIDGWGEDETKASGPSRNDLNKFAERVAYAKEGKVGGELPGIEAPRRVIEHYNHGSMAGFESAGYFVYGGVKVYETGKRAEIEARDKQTMEQRLHGGK